jgi:alpha-galactosidase/6-phospho-beta-glucosidase family protein
MKDSNQAISASPVLTIVGAGSLNWGRHIVVDMMLNPDLAGAEIRLVDLNEERLAMVLEWCELARRRLGHNHKISAHTDLKEGLRGATACLTAISVGGDRLWRYDSTHPQLDGIFQAVGDTTGPGGAIRALRHAPVMRGIAQTLAEVGAPDALLLQLTNPLNARTASIDRIPGIRVYGFCHGYHDTEHSIAIALGLIPLHTAHNSEWRPNAPLVRVELAGNNHFVFADKLQIGDRTFTQKEIHELTPQIFDGPFREAVWSRYGV